MEYSALVDVYDRLAATASNNEKCDIVAESFAGAGDLLPRLAVLVRGRLFPAYDRGELGVSSSLTLEAILAATGAAESEVRERWRETGDLGDAAAWAVDNGGQQTLFSRELTVERVHDDLRGLADFEGEGSQGRRVDALAGLVSDATADEARYVVRTALGHLRVGVGEGTIRDAVAVAFLGDEEGSTEAVERAYQVTNDFGVVAETARDGGVDALRELDVELFRPIQLMLAEKAETLGEGLADAAADGGEAVRCEYKYDGIRVQIHVDGDEVRLFTRRLEEVTPQFPDVVRAVREGVAAERAIFDGELVGYAPETVAEERRSPVVFQTLSRRVKRESDIEEIVREIPVVVHLFDCLYDGETALDRPASERLDRLEAAFSPVAPDAEAGVAGLERATSASASPDDPDPAAALYEEALERGHEGLMMKNAAAAYQPGRRVGRMLKLKPTMEPLDLVVTRAKYSEGRRSEWLGRLYLACYDPETDELREVGRLSTGYTDEELAALTEELEARVVNRDGRLVELEPEVVLAVEYEEIQSSTEYESGYALRFPRFLNVRADLGRTDADTFDRVESLYDSQ
ncbi:DNA ligase (ATP) [Halogeometricum pallidum JCM 14848]|uniref:DNA ligase n=1 Tax=Halogeometricum pallidum JCM 14848 TaxID=1227487 RepID=M0CZ81_HALPD|nr:ATP-dependent DNA ligase [Halogeometricum pallidum]ELZ28526.1 DNA ligase (ATP) [Halogeometricum pallidum JCM 14848]